MCTCRSSSSRQTSFGGPVGRGDWAGWLPLVFIGAMMFWTVALGLGGWSLMAVTDGVEEAVGPAPTVTEPMPGAAAQGAQGATGGSDRIPVQVEESQEPEDVNDNAGAASPSAPVWGGVFDR